MNRAQNAGSTNEPTTEPYGYWDMGRLIMSVVASVLVVLAVVYWDKCS